jgi:Ca2+-binding EF-hand superfamily protein
MMEFFLQKFGELDPDNCGWIPLDDARAVLASVGMSHMQAETLLLEAQPDGRGRVQYKKFARVCAQISSAYQGDNAPTALNAEKRRARAIALFRRVDIDRSGKIEDSEMIAWCKRLAAKFRTKTDEAAILNMVESFKGKVITEEVFADFMLETYQAVSDEQFFEWLDYCDTPSYYARVRRLRTLFWKLDSDGSGIIDMDEKRQYAKKLGSRLGVPVTDEWINQAVCDFAFIDSNCDGKITEEEFITAFLELFETVEDELFLEGLGMFDVRSDTDRRVIFANMFRRHDLDNDGFLDAKEVKTYFKNFAAKMGQPISDEELAFAVKQFQAVDANGDGVISMEEFVNYFMSETANASDEDFYQQIEFFDA